MSETSSSEEEFRMKKKRGVRNIDSYKHNIIKKAKIQGLAHTNHVGKTVPPRKTGENCM